MLDQLESKSEAQGKSNQPDLVIEFESKFTNKSLTAAKDSQSSSLDFTVGDPLFNKAGDTLVAKLSPAEAAQRQLDQSARQLREERAFRYTGGIPVDISEADKARNVFDRIDLNKGTIKAIGALELLTKSEAGQVLFDAMQKKGVRVEVLPDTNSKLDIGGDAKYDEGAKRIYVRASAMLRGGGHGETPAQILGEELLHGFIPGYSQREEYYAKMAASELARRGGDNVRPDEAATRKIVKEDYGDWARQIAIQTEDIQKILSDKLKINVPKW